jgi:hypothetical protein
VKEEIDFDGPIERGAKKMRAQRVQEYGFAVSIDGDFGPATEKRVRDFQAARGLPATGVVDMKTHVELVAPIVKALNPIAAGGKSLSTLAAAYAKQHIKNHPREIGGDNRGPWVRSYLDWDGKDARWCAGFVCFALEQAAHTLGVDLPIESSSSCDVLAMEAKTAGKFVPESKVKSGAFAKKDLVPGTFFLVRKVRLGACRHRDRASQGVVRHCRGKH